MKLSYRGVDYDYQPTQIKVGGTINVVKFRGNTYKVDYDYQPLFFRPTAKMIRSLPSRTKIEQ